ncbi:MAG: substrate-binding domain-containing protein [Actinomycetota bacterium]
MRHSKNLFALIAGILVLSLVAAACGGSDDEADAGDTAEVTGSVNVSGSSTVEQISSLNAEKFAGENPSVEIAVDGPGTSDGFELFCAGDTDMNDASRAIDDEEADACEAAGVTPVELEVGLDALTVVTNPENPVDCLALGDLYALFGPESEGFTQWSDANELATEVGGNGGLPDVPLTIVAPGEESGTYGSFIEIALADIAEAQKQPDDQLRKDYQASGDDNVIIDNAANNSSGLGFVGLSFALGAGDTVKAVEVDGGDGCVAPSEETVIDGTYPLARSLYIYPSAEKAAVNAAVAAFVDYYLTDEGLASVSEVGYVSLPDDRVRATRSAWEKAVG